MQYEQIQQPMKEKVASLLEHASQHAIAGSRLEQLEEELGQIKEKFITNGYRTPEDNARDDEIEAELLQSSAVVKTLPEFDEMLSQIAEKYGLSKEWAVDLKAHENAHANVSEITGHESLGYAAVFIKDEQGNLSNVQPLFFGKPNLEWGPQEAIEKDIQVLDAPRAYGNAPSEYDVADIAKNEERLRKIADVRARLGFK